MNHRRFTHQLPATPCPEGLRQRVEAVATQNAMSIAHFQRMALEFFLQHLDNLTTPDQAPGTGVETPPSVPAPRA